MAHPVDLHAHSHYSDGTRAPARLVAEAAAADIRVLGLTDHDTVAGVSEAVAAGRATGVEVVPGVEISTSLPVGETEARRVPVHLLGYAFDPDDEELLDTLAFHARARARRVRRMAAKLTALGAPVSAERVFALAGPGSVGRVHVGLALVEAGHAASVADAFDRFLGRHHPAYVRRPPVDTEESVRLIRRAGGVPVLAHPWEYRSLIDLDLLLRRLVAAGLAGIEVAYGGYDEPTRATLQALADRHRLIATGGSDYHGPDVKPDRPLGMAAVPEEAVSRLRQAAAAIRAGGEA